MSQKRTGHDPRPQPVPSTDHREGQGLPANAAVILFVSSLVPLLMAAHGDGRAYLWTGLGMLAVGAALWALGRRRARATR